MRQIRIFPQFALGLDAESKRLRVTDELRGEWNNQRGRGPGVNQRLSLDNEHGSGLSGLRPTSGVQGGELYLTALVGWFLWRRTPH